MSDHCHGCGEDQSLDDAAVVSATLMESDDEELRSLAKAFLSAYITRRHNRLTAPELPRFS